MIPGRVYDDIFLEHGEPWHVENRTRLEAIVARLQSTGLWDELEDIPVLPAEDEQLAWVHDEDYLEELRMVSQAGGGAFDSDTVATSLTYGAAATAAGSCMWVARLLAEGHHDQALCLVRPPGHHALPGRAMGFCFLNNAALAAEMALVCGMSRVAIVDWDVHHGNGTQDIFYSRGEVFYFSIHQHGLYPGTGSLDEVGVDQGLARTVNLPLPAAAQDQHYLRALEEVIAPAVRRYAPELLIVSAGYDGHHTDPLASHALTTDGYYELTRRVHELAVEVCAGRLCVILEGGYATEALAHCVENTVLAMLERPVLAPEASAPQVHPVATERVDEYLDHAVAVHRARLEL